MNHSMTVGTQHRYVGDLGTYSLGPLLRGPLRQWVKVMNLCVASTYLSIRLDEIKTAHLTNAAIELLGMTGQGRISLKERALC